ncbi:hypothetical protein ACFQ14_00865 [Pseudahrensia aquimaris]|uniref:Uncharacterized protein n=1 Tax=Pseudahrensia aquimaris TaxID=744461 RepID=A0ABW3FDR1_9HYPH
MLGAMAGAVLILVSYQHSTIQNRNATILSQSNTSVEFYERQFEKASEAVQKAIFLLRFWDAEPLNTEQDKKTNRADAKRLIIEVSSNFFVHTSGFEESELRNALNKCRSVFSNRLTPDLVSDFASGSKNPEEVINALQDCHAEAVRKVGGFVADKVGDKVYSLEKDQRVTILGFGVDHSVIWILGFLSAVGVFFAYLYWTSRESDVPTRSEN